MLALSRRYHRGLVLRVAYWVFESLALVQRLFAGCELACGQL